MPCNAYKYALRAHVYCQTLYLNLDSATSAMTRSKADANAGQCEDQRGIPYP